MAKTFEELDTWKTAKELSIFIYRLFRECKDFKFRDQIQSAAVSVMNNIAEGFERKSRKEFARFLCISKGSAGEVRSMLYLALELKFISQKDFDEAKNVAVKASVQIYKLLSSL